MFDFDNKLAKLAVQYAVNVQKGDKVIIMAPAFAENLIQELYIEILKAGGYPSVRTRINGLQEVFFTHASDDQLEYTDPIITTIGEQYNQLISVQGDFNTRELETIDPNKLRIAQSSPGYTAFRKMLDERERKGEFRWTIIPYPCHALAQDAGLGIRAYKEFIASALALADDPVAHWKEVEKEHDRLIQVLDQVDQIHVLGDDTDLTLSVKGRKWVNCCGHKNLPDGEVFTGPIEDSLNGHIRFTYPGIYMGKEVENIYLEFKDGKVVKATADKGEELLKTLLEIPGATGIGEFALGTNYNITKFTKNMLFDEKIGGTLHMALGKGMLESGSKAESAIHWDILKDMKSEDSQVIADGKVIYQAGKWLI